VSAEAREREGGPQLTRMKTEIVDVNETRKSLRVEIPRDVVDAEIDRLARDGYVKRAPDPRDGRRVALRITKPGARLRDQMTVLDPERVRKMLARMKPAERREALRGLELLARAADQFIAQKTKERTFA